MPRLISVHDESELRVPQATSCSIKLRIPASSTSRLEIAPAGRATNFGAGLPCAGSAGSLCARKIPDEPTTKTTDVRASPAKPRADLLRVVIMSSRVQPKPSRPFPARRNAASGPKMNPADEPLAGTSAPRFCAGLRRECAAASVAIRLAAPVLYPKAPTPPQTPPNTRSGREMGGLGASRRHPRRGPPPARGYPSAANASAAGCVHKRQRTGGATPANQWSRKTDAKWRCRARSAPRILVSRRAKKARRPPSHTAQTFPQNRREPKVSRRPITMNPRSRTASSAAALEQVAREQKNANAHRENRAAICLVVQRRAARQWRSRRRYRSRRRHGDRESARPAAAASRSSTRRRC